MKTRKFNNKKQAKAFANSVKGFVEGPFFDEHITCNYIVFYKERRTR